MPPHSFSIQRFGSLSSTQDEARAQARAGAPSGTLILAAEQLAGRGRQGRVWESPAGLGLTFTVIHRTARPPAEWPLFTLAASLGMSEGIDPFGIASRLKWPNDLLLSGRKVAGTLADTERSAILIGIGLNVLQKEEDFPEPLRDIATSIAIECGRKGRVPPSMEDLLDSILCGLERRLRDLEGAGGEPILAAFWSRCSDRGRRIEVRLPSGESMTGEAIGLGSAGALLLSTESGVLPLSAGEIVRRVAP